VRKEIFSATSSPQMRLQRPRKRKIQGKKRLNKEKEDISRCLDEAAKAMDMENCM
jgi:hypothetical protein